MTEIEQQMKLFIDQGGRFISSVEQIGKSVQIIHGFIFDWDGVFHAGRKGENESGLFSEADSMGTNMLRYGYWLKHGRLPLMAIISGERDKAALRFAEREHISAIYTGIRDKKQALEHVCTNFGLTSAQLACFFDDVNDLSMVEQCGLRFQVRRPASPLFMEYTIKNGMCDYITGQIPDGYAVRECCELLLGFWGNYSDVIRSRTAYDKQYQEYWSARNNTKTLYYSRREDQIIASERN